MNPRHLQPPEEDHLPILHELWQSFTNLSESTALESYHDACHWMSEIHTMYIHGLMGLKSARMLNKFIMLLARNYVPSLKPTIRAHREIIDELNEKLAHKFVCNFSLISIFARCVGNQSSFPYYSTLRLRQTAIVTWHCYTILLVILMAALILTSIIMAWKVPYRLAPL